MLATIILLSLPARSSILLVKSLTKYSLSSKGPVRFKTDLNSLISLASVFPVFPFSFSYLSSLIRVR